MSVLSFIFTTVAAVLSAVWLGGILWRKISPAKSLRGIPLVEFSGGNSRDRYTKEAASLLVKGYDEYTKNGEPFCIRDFLNPDRPRVFLPVKYMEEVRNAPQEKLSLPATLNTATISKVGGPQITNEVQTTTRIDLNRALNKLIEPMQALCFRAAEQVMPDCPEWTSVVMYPNVLELFSRMSARVMVGAQLCDNWPAISMKYVTSVLAAAGAMRKKYYPMFYWTAYYLNPEVALVTKTRREAAEVVRPVLEARQAAYKAQGAAVEKHDDFIQWIMDSYRANGKTITADELVQNIFVVMFASLHGTSFIALQSLFSILGTDGAVSEIREEIERVAKEELGSSTVWTRHALGQLRSMDSFMKESLRMKPLHEATVQRVAMSPYTFKDGLHVPENTMISFPNLRFNLDATRSAIGHDAGTFHGKRWLERRTSFNASKFQFASTAEDAFDWGGGPHACPGRFMADVTIKLILLCLITKYDMKLVEGKDTQSQARRFLDLAPDTSMPIMVRDVRD